MSKLLFNKAFSEHCSEDISSEQIEPCTIFYQQKQDCKCIEIIQDESSKKLLSSYYIGADWLIRNELAVYIEPKINEESQKTDYFKMLFSCLKHTDILNYSKDLYEIKFDEPFIEIDYAKDLITPLLFLQFLQLLKLIVQKGLKKSYYKVEQNLNCKIKGKVLVSKTIKKNILKNQQTKTICQFYEFGVNSIENRVLKRTLTFTQKYLSSYPNYYKRLADTINYCRPAFEQINEEVDLRELKNVKHNSFFKEYKEVLHISSLILKRFGYNIKNINAGQELIKVPPFWIDMSKLFELYVLGKLKDTYGNKIKFQIKGTYGSPDFLLVSETEKIIIDTKYKPIYQSEKYVSDDIRQLSGYARDIGVLKHLGFNSELSKEIVVDCLIIYPAQLNENASEDLSNNLKENTISGFTKFYKMQIKLPVINYEK